MKKSKMKVVLVEPEIPFNTGSIGRTCVALDLELILVGKLGFSLDSSSVARSGTRYWKSVQLDRYNDWAEFVAVCGIAASLVVVVYGLVSL